MLLHFFVFVILNIVPQIPNSLIGVHILSCGASVMLMDFVHLPTREIIAFVVILSVWMNPTFFRFSMNLRDFIDCETKQSCGFSMGPEVKIYIENNPRSASFILVTISSSPLVVTSQL